MPQIISDFDERKAIEIILYVSRRVPDPTKLVICKLLFFADKTSLERYGRFISGDNYAALPLGPVPSQIYNLIKEGIGERTGAFKVDGNRIVALRDASTEWFSESDIECLNETINQNSNKPAWQIKEESHQDITYREAWARRGKANSVPMDIESIASNFDNSEALVSFIKTRHRE
jgi:uncharacterized phage-associated protein